MPRPPSTLMPPKSRAAALKLNAMAGIGFDAQPKCPDSNESGDEIAGAQRRPDRLTGLYGARGLRKRLRRRRRSIGVAAR